MQVVSKRVSTMKGLKMSWRSRRRCCMGESVTGLKPPLDRGLGASIRHNFFKICVLSPAIYRHFSALFQGQDFFPLIQREI